MVPIPTAKSLGSHLLVVSYRIQQCKFSILIMHIVLCKSELKYKAILDMEPDFSCVSYPQS